MRTTRPYWAGIAALLAVAFALRLHGLDRRALWWDEGLTLFFARLNLLENAAFAGRLADTNPPFYRLMLGGWTALAGSSAFTARLFSVIAGVVTVAATVRIGRDWLGRAGSLLAGAMTAASPMLIYFSREAKAYSLVAACGMLASLLWLRMLRHDRYRAQPRLWLAYGLLLAIPLGSHYITGFLIATQAGWLALRLLSFSQREQAEGTVETPRQGVSRPRPHRAPAVYLTATLGAVLAVQAPFWLLTYGGASAAVRGETGVFEGLHGPGEFFGAHLLEFAVGPGAKTEANRGNAAIESKPFMGAIDGQVAGISWLCATALLTLVSIGLIADITKGFKTSLPYLPAFLRFPEVLIISLIAFPLLAGYLLNLYHEFFFPRFLLYSTPPFLLLAAAGLLRLIQSGRPGRIAALVLAAAPIVAWTAYLVYHYASPNAEAPAEDWRPLAAALRQHTRASDAAIYVWGWMPGYLHAYLPPGAEPVYYLGNYTPASVGPELERIVARHSRVWLLDYQIDQFDPRNSAGRWLGERGALVYSEWFGNAHVALFLPGDPLSGPPPGEAQTVEFANGLQLRWTPIYVELSPGEAVGLGLDWAAPGQVVSRRYTVFLHGVAGDGSLAFGRDSEPVNGLRPTDTWAAGEQVRDWRGALLPPDLEPGDYRLDVGLYDTLSQQLVTTRDGQPAVTAGRVRVR